MGRTLVKVRDALQGVQRLFIETLQLAAAFEAGCQVMIKSFSALGE